MIQSQKDITLSADCPNIMGIKVVGELGKGGQADIYEVMVEKVSEFPED